SMDRELDSLLESLDDISAGVEDISMALRAKTAAYEYDPATIETLEEKLHFIQDLKRKHRTDEQGLIDLKTELESRLALAEDSNEAIRQAREAHLSAKAEYEEILKGFLEARTAFART